MSPLATATAKPRAALASSSNAIRGQITVTTKYGISPAKRTSLITLGRRIAGPIVKNLPGVKQRLAQMAKATTRNKERPTFTAAQARASLARQPRRPPHRPHRPLAPPRSQRQRPPGRRSPPLPRRPKCKQGTIGSFGIGSSADKVPALLAERPAYCRTLQYELVRFSTRPSNPPARFASTTAPSPTTSTPSTPLSLKTNHSANAGPPQ